MPTRRPRINEAARKDILLGNNSKRKMFNIEVKKKSQNEYPEEDYICPEDHYGSCDKHIVEFEMDH